MGGERGQDKRRVHQLAPDEQLQYRLGRLCSARIGTDHKVLDGLCESTPLISPIPRWEWRKEKRRTKRTSHCVSAC